MHVFSFQCLVGICCLGRRLFLLLMYLFVRCLLSAALSNDGIDVFAPASGHCLARCVLQVMDVAYEAAPTQQRSACFLVCATHTSCSKQRMHFRLRSACVLVCAWTFVDAAHNVCSAQHMVFACAAHGLFVYAAHKCFPDATRRCAHHAPHICVNGARHVSPNRVLKLQRLASPPASYCPSFSRILVSE